MVGTFFALKVQTPRQQPFLVALTGLDDVATERVVVDPDVIDPSGETTIDFFVPSPDGTKVAVSLSEHGTEDGVHCTSTRLAPEMSWTSRSRT